MTSSRRMTQTGLPARGSSLTVCPGAAYQSVVPPRRSQHKGWAEHQQRRALPQRDSALGRQVGRQMCRNPDSRGRNGRRLQPAEQQPVWRLPVCQWRQTLQMMMISSCNWAPREVTAMMVMMMTWRQACTLWSMGQIFRQRPNHTIWLALGSRPLV